MYMYLECFGTLRPVALPSGSCAIYTLIYIYIHIYTHTQTHTHAHTQMNAASLNIDMYVCIYICTYMHVCLILIHIHMYISYIYKCVTS